MNTALPQENAESASKEDIRRLKTSLIEQSSLFKGPIPPPQHLEHYEKILPGSADRILKMAEMQLVHRHNLENKQTDIEISQNESDIQLAKQEMSERKRGQWLAFTITMASLVGGIIITLSGKPVWGSIFGGAGLASVLLVFYSNKLPRFKKKN